MPPRSRVIYLNHVGRIMEARRRDPRLRWHDAAVLYRMNAESRPLQAALREAGVPYVVREEDDERAGGALSAKPGDAPAHHRDAPNDSPDAVTRTTRRAVSCARPASSAGERDSRTARRGWRRPGSLRRPRGAVDLHAVPSPAASAKARLDTRAADLVLVVPGACCRLCGLAPGMTQGRDPSGCARHPA
jgi:hypothetical protein